MPNKRILISPYIAIDGDELTEWFSAVAIEGTDDEVDISSFGSRYREIGKGLKDASITGTVFNDDEGATAVNKVLYPLSEGDDQFLIEVRADRDTSESNDNPTWWMVGKLFNFTPLGGAVGEASTTDITIRNASQAGIGRSS